MDVGQIVSLIITVLLVISGLYFAQRGARRGIIKAAMTTGNIVLSACLACFLSRDFTTIARDYIYPLAMLILRLVGLGDVEQELAEVEGLVALLPLFLGVLITPFLFLLFFAIFRAIIGLILTFVYRPKKKAVDEDGNKVRVKRHIPLWSRICGGVLGVLNGALLIAVLLIPLNGYANLAVNVAKEYYAEIDTSTYSREGGSAGEIVYFALNDYVMPATDNWFLKASYGTLGRPMFIHMTETAYGKGEFGLENEAIVGIRLLRNGGKFVTGGLTNLNEQSVKDLHGIVNTLDQSAIMPELAATFVSSMCDNWAYGGDLFGLERPDFGQVLNPTFDVLLGILATVDGETLIADLNTLLDLMDLLVKNGFFGNHHESEQLVDVFGKNPKLLQEMAAVFESNEHLYPMVEEIRMLCIRIVAQSLDMGNEELTGKLTETINAYKDHPELLSGELTGIVQEYLHDQGLSATVGDDVIQEIADVINQEFAGQDYVTEQEVIDLVLTYAQGNFTDEEIGNVVPGYGDDWTNGN
ncbi:MAG: CvpA family protein [Clostridia bacterium]|nr:CvpA family protein [Clostridia bacterium]